MGYVRVSPRRSGHLRLSADHSLNAKGVPESSTEDGLSKVLGPLGHDQAVVDGESRNAMVEGKDLHGFHDHLALSELKFTPADSK